MSVASVAGDVSTGVRRRAIQDFYHARRRAKLQQLMARLRGWSARLLCYEQVRDRLRPETSHGPQLEMIPLEAIVGSVERCGDYTRDFLPLKDSDQRRWTRVMAAASKPVDLPPIRVYRIDEVCFVIDGHHRVSVARQRGSTHIEAWVTDVQTRLPVASLEDWA
jgi:hypothetical protein